jgi:cyclin-dependent kinase
MTSDTHIQATFPQWKAQDLGKYVVEKLAHGRIAPLEPEALDLLRDMLQYSPGSRISAKAALVHPYFNDLDRSSFGSE